MVGWIIAANVILHINIHHLEPPSYWRSIYSPSDKTNWPNITIIRLYKAILKRIAPSLSFDMNKINYNDLSMNLYCTVMLRGILFNSNANNLFIIVSHGHKLWLCRTNATTYLAQKCNELRNIRFRSDVASLWKYFKRYERSLQMQISRKYNAIRIHLYLLYCLHLRYISVHLQESEYCNAFYSMKWLLFSVIACESLKFLLLLKFNEK